MNKQHKKALVENHNRDYEQTTAQEDEQLAKDVIAIIVAELEPESLEGWKQSQKCIENRVMKSLGLQSKYRADGTVR